MLSCRTSPDARSVGLATPLEEDRVAPDAVELRNAGPHGEGAVAGGVVQRDGGTVFREDRGLQGPQPAGVGLVDLAVEQGLADTSSAGALGDVDAGLGDPRVDLPG